MVRPLLEYCCVVWDPHQEKLVRQLENVHRSGARFVAGKPFNRRNPDSVTKILEDLGWEPLMHRRRRTKLTFMYKMVNGIIDIPMTHFPERKERASTRHANNHQFLQPQANLQLYQHSYVPSTVPFWNRLPDDVISAPSVTTFKQRLAKIEMTP